METTAPDSRVGKTLDGRYVIRARLARGGMATVYEALDLRLDRIVALKVMHQHLAEDPDFVARFHREAKSAARLSHPHVVAVFDQGQANGLTYLAMEMVPGRTLRDVLHDFGPLSPEQALVILDPVLEGIAAAHAAGVVHRDIKPENVLMSDDGRVKVADFGLARAVTTSNASATQGLIIGTVSYLSPEQVDTGDADGRSDVYSAGILLYEMVTNDVPYSGDNPLTVAYKHVNNDVPPPSRRRPGLPAELDALVIRATRRDPALRYQRATDFLADVRRVRTSLPPPRPFIEARDTLVVDTPQAARAKRSKRKEHNEVAAPVSIAQRRRRKWPWVALGLLLAVFAAAASGWFLAAGNSIPTPNIVGQTTAKAVTVLEKSGLTLDVVEEQFSENLPPDTIISSDPAPGDGVSAGGSVGVIVSKGPERFAVPEVRGMSPAEASTALTEAGLVVTSTTQVFDSSIEANTVAGTDPKIGSEVKRGTNVEVQVSKGPKPVEIPTVIGRKSNAASGALKDAGLGVDLKEKFSESIPRGTVIAVHPAAGNVVNFGTQVELVVSKGPPPVTVPNLVDMPQDKAIAALNSLGLKVKIVESAKTPLNRVLSQDPPGGTKLPKGSTVTIKII